MNAMQDTAETHLDLGRHLITTTTRPDTVFDRGEGSWLTDETGKRYLDLVQGWAVNSLGHSPAVLQAALAAQAGRLMCPSPAYFNRPALALAERLAQLSGLDRVFLASTGAEANEGAVKLARRWGQKHKSGAHEVITFENSFHGRTLAMMAASGKTGWDQIFAPMPQGFCKARLNDIESVARLIGPNTAAVLIEPVQGEGGVQLASPQFMQQLRELTTRHRVLLMLDEVQTGIGRCGTAFAFQQLKVRPDVLTLAKGLGGGVPLAALLCGDSLDCFNPGDQGGTYAGNALMAAVGLAVVNTVCEPGFLQQVQQRAQQLSAGLEHIARDMAALLQPAPAAAQPTGPMTAHERGLGLLRVLVLPTPCARQVVEAARCLQPTGLLLNAPRPNLLRFMPALNISEAEVDEALRLLWRALQTPW